MFDRMTTALVLSQALFRAVAAKRLARGLIPTIRIAAVNTVSMLIGKQLQQFGMLASMSRKGDCWSNVPMESFWCSLKNELVHHRCFATRKQAKRENTEKTKMFYNCIHKQEQLGYLSPAAFSQRYYAKRMAA